MAAQPYFGRLEGTQGRYIGWINPWPAGVLSRGLTKTVASGERGHDNPQRLWQTSEEYPTSPRVANPGPFVPKVLTGPRLPPTVFGRDRTASHILQRPPGGRWPSSWQRWTGAKRTGGSWCRRRCSTGSTAIHGRSSATTRKVRTHEAQLRLRRGVLRGASPGWALTEGAGVKSGDVQGQFGIHGVGPREPRAGELTRIVLVEGLVHRSCSRVGIDQHPQ